MSDRDVPDDDLDARLDRVLADLGGGKAALLYLQGDHAFEAGDYYRALESYSEALRVDPSLVECRYSRALALTHLDRAEEAEHEYSVILERDPTYVSAYVNRGCLRMAAQALGEALSDFDAALALDGEHAGAWFNRGTVLGMLGRYADAEQCLSTALRHRPDYGKARVARAQARLHLGRLEEAEQDLELARELGFRDPHTDVVESAARAMRERAEGGDGREDRAGGDRQSERLAAGIDDGSAQKRYRAEGSYREMLRPRGEWEKPKAMLAAFLRADDRRSFLEFALEHPMVVEEAAIAFFEELAERKENAPIRRSVLGKVELLRLIALQVSDGTSR